MASSPTDATTACAVVGLTLHRMCAARLWSLVLVAAALDACCHRAWFTTWLASASEIRAVVCGVLQLDELLSMISSMVHGFCGTYFHSRLCVQWTCISVLSPLAGLALPVSKRIAAGALMLEPDHVHVCRYRECVCVGSVLGAYDTQVIRTLRAPREIFSDPTRTVLQPRFFSHGGRYRRRRYPDVGREHAVSTHCRER